MYQIGGAALNGCYFSNHYSPDDADPAVQKFVSDYKARYGTVPDALAATAYDAARIMFDAIKRANSLDGAAIRAALAATNEFPGVTGKVTFNENRDAVKPIVMIKIQEGGKFVVAERVQVEGAAMPTTDNAVPRRPSVLHPRQPFHPRRPDLQRAQPPTTASPATRNFAVSDNHCHTVKLNLRFGFAF